MLMDDTQKKVWYLRRLDLFLSLTDEEVKEIAGLLDQKHVPAGVEILGDRKHEQIYLINTGTVRLYISEHGQQVSLALLGPGRLFGLSSTFGATDPAIGAITLEPSYICFATSTKLLEAFSHYPQVMLRMTAALAEQIFFTETWIEHLHTQDPRSRLAQLLLELGDEYCDLIHGNRQIRFRLTQTDLARMLNVSRETVSRLMAAFNRKGWVARDHGLLIIHNRAALDDMAHGRSVTSLRA